MTSKFYRAEVSVNLSKLVGSRGSFKTCHDIQMWIEADAGSALKEAFGISDFDQVVAKRCFTQKEPSAASSSGRPRAPQASKVYRYTSAADEAGLMIREANCNCIGSALMRTVNKYVMF